LLNEQHSLQNLHRGPFNLENYYYEANVPAFFQQQNMSFASNSMEDKLSSCQAIDEFQDPNFPFHMTPSRVTTRTAQHAAMVMEIIRLLVRDNT
jgi:hypothetical protein